MKWVIFLTLFLYADVKIYVYTIKMNYEEFTNSSLLDKDSTYLFDLNGIRVKYYNVRYFLNMEFAYGRSVYQGKTWSNKDLRLVQKDVNIFNIKGAYFLNKKFYLLGGYRRWNRGKSDYEGDYNEIYYWSYIGIGKFFRIKNLTASIEYQYAINPKLRVLLGNGALLKLGETNGLSGEVRYSFLINDIVWEIFYRCWMWFVDKSNTSEITLKNSLYNIYEPASLTINQYFGIGIRY
ncbi:MAG: hypothetical protein ABGX26_07685 [Nautiliaceae bacterium]